MLGGQAWDMGMGQGGGQVAQGHVRRAITQVPSLLAGGRGSLRTRR